MGANWLWAAARTEGHDTQRLSRKHCMQFNTRDMKGNKTRYGGERTWGLRMRNNSGMRRAAPPDGFLLILYSGKLFLHFSLTKTPGMMAEEQKEGAQCQAGEREMKLIIISTCTHTLSEMSTQSLGSIECNLKEVQCCQGPAFPQNCESFVLLLQAVLYFAIFRDVCRKEFV